MEFIILTRRSNPAVTAEKFADTMSARPEMTGNEKPAKCEAAQGFPLARVVVFPYNPGDFCILRVSPTGIAVANPNGQPNSGHHSGGRK